MPNKQPFYHRVVVLFTATREVSSKEMKEAVDRGFGGFYSDPRSRVGKVEGVLSNTIEIEECDAEPGDPADLL